MFAYIDYDQSNIDCLFMSSFWTTWDIRDHDESTWVLDESDPRHLVLNESSRWLQMYPLDELHYPSQLVAHIGCQWLKLIWIKYKNKIMTFFLFTIVSDGAFNPTPTFKAFSSVTLSSFNDIWTVPSSSSFLPSISFKLSVKICCVAFLSFSFWRIWSRGIYSKVKMIDSIRIDYLEYLQE